MYDSQNPPRLNDLLADIIEIGVALDAKMAEIRARQAAAIAASPTRERVAPEQRATDGALAALEDAYLRPSHTR